MGNDKILLAYSGGLDTSVVLRWLLDKYKTEVYCLIVNVGQDEDLDKIAQIALQNGATDVLIEDARDEFAEEFYYQMLKANPVYESYYLMGSSISRPLIAKRQVETASRISANAVSHGATGKGNDQVRFELTYAALAPELKVISPWRIWKLKSRGDLIRYAQDKEIALMYPVSENNPLSIDQNLINTTYEGELLENAATVPSSEMYKRTNNLANTPDDPELVEIGFIKGIAVSIDGHKKKPREVIETLNRIGSLHGVGRIDMVENRIFGMKSRNIYESPGATILLKAHIAAESMCLDKEVILLKEELMPKYARCVYNGYWFSPEREVLQAAIDRSQVYVNANITVRLFKGNVDVVSRDAKSGLYRENLASFTEDLECDHRHASGFIQLNKIRLKLYHEQKKYELDKDVA